MSVRKFLIERLNPGSYLGLQLTTGALVLLAASWIFGSIADEVLENDDFAAIDLWLSQWANGLDTPHITPFMRTISDMHGTFGMTVLVTITAVLLAWKRYWPWLMVLLITVPGGATLNVLMKRLFERARPQFDSPFLTLTDYSFPSGHTCAATLFYGVVASVLVPRIRSWQGRALVCTGALAMIMLVAFSRLYLGAHFLTDVLAGFVEGVAWLALCLTAIHTFVSHRAWKRRA